MIDHYPSFDRVDLFGQVSAAPDDHGSEVRDDAGQLGRAPEDAVEVADAVERSGSWIPIAGPARADANGAG